MGGRVFSGERENWCVGRKGTFCSAYQAQKGCPVAVRKSKDILLKFVLDLSGTLKSVSLKSSSENRPSPTGKLGRYMRSYSAFLACGLMHCMRPSMLLLRSANPPHDNTAAAGFLRCKASCSASN